MAARTMGSRGVRLGSALCVLVLLSSASSVSSHRRSHQPRQPDAVEVSYFPNSYHNFGFRAKLSDAELLQQELDVLQLQNDLNPAFQSSGNILQHWNILHQGVDKDVLQFRRKRAVTSVTATEQVAEDKTGVLIDFNTKFSNLVGRRFSLNSTSGNPEMFEVTSGGQLKLRDGFQLDYEVASMRSITFVVHATSTSDSTDVYEISATLTVTNVDEAPVFETKPQPYLATVRTDTGSSYSIIILVAKDPEGAPVQYEKTAVSPNTYNNRIELRSQTVNGVRQCELRTVGSGSFLPEGQTISITVSAMDASSGGKVAATTVSVMIGVRPPQFYQSSYQGAMPEKNLPQQTVYKLGTSEELKVEWKTFQGGTVTLSLTGEGGSDSDKFEVKRGSGNWANIVCKTELDYEAANPKTQALTLTAVQRVGTVDLTNNISVTVKIEDTNDNSPVFDRSQYLKTIPENFSLGVSIMDVVARDRDTGVNAQIEYSLEDTQYFEIITNRLTGDPPTYSGNIRAIKRLDFDRKSGPFYVFSVKATDKGTPPKTSMSNIQITVTNVNDERPQFLISAGQQYEVQENANVNQFIAQVQATDGDGDKVRYSFANGQLFYEKFKIDANSGVVTLNQPITDTDDRFNLTIRATDDGSCCPSETQTWSNETYIYVQVYGANDERPDFKACSQYNPNVNENSDPGTSVIRVTAEDNDRGPNGDVTYSLIQSQNVFNINPSTGLITVKGPIDREATAYIQVTVKATDGGTPPEEGYCTFRVIINDVNDNTPRFDKNRYVANITLGIPKNVPFASVRAYDDDVGTNAAIVYSLPDDGEGKFAIIPENGFISLTQALTGEYASQSFSLTAMAKDEGVPVSLNSTVTVLVNVGTTDLRPPVWDQDYNTRTYTVPETAAAGYVVIPNMECSSQNSDSRVEFQLVKEDGTTSTSTEFFSLRPGRNNVTVLATGKFDYAKKSEHIIRIRCVNFDAITLITEAIPKVILNDTNNQIPEFLGLSPSTGRYAASVQERKPIGTSVLTVEATDKDSTPLYKKITFSIEEGGENFTITAGSKENTAVIRTKIVFDRETKNNYFLSLKATDGAPSSLPGVPPGQHNTATVFVNVEISDVNDNPPTFPQQMYQVQVPESTYINDLIDPPIVADDPDDSDRGRHTYRIISGNTNNPAFGIRNGLGNLFPLRKLDFEGADKNFLLTVEASDGLHSATTMVNVTVMDVNDNSPVFSPDFYPVTNVTENDRSGPQLLLTAVATDADVNRPNNIRYSLEGSSFVVSNFFSINEVTGQLYLNAPLDRDPPDGRPNYQFTIKAADELQDPNYGYATVSVMPRDVNDNAPKFVAPDPLEASVDENAPRDTTVVRIQAVDNDAGENGTVVFSISSIVDGANVARPGYFTVDRDLGIVKTNTDPGNLDRETQDTYRLAVVLEDKGTPPQQTTGTLTVTLSDLNDQPPVFEKRIYRIDMSENQKVGEVIRVVAKDNDVGENAKIYYVLSGDLVHFSVKSIDNEGSVQIAKPVDYEDPTQRFFNLTVKAQDKAAHTDTCIVEITVLDFNDNAPKIQPQTLTRNISEDASPGTRIATFSATDDDDTDINKAFEFSISRASDPRRHFSIDSKAGEVKVRRRLDRETQAVHELTILAIDKGSPPLSGTATLTVIVEDVNDNYPTFKEDYRPVVPENVKNVDRTVQIVSAKDPDAYPYGAPYGFQLADCKEAVCDSDSFGFRFNKDGDGGNGTAIITTTNTQFDREKKKYYLIPIVMWDMRGPTRSPESLTGTNTLTIIIGDENDSPMEKGTQHMFVYNYKGKFGPLEIGRVYVEDPDDWDLPDKTFNYTGPNWMKNYFTVDFNTGMVTMKKGVPSNAGQAPYRFTVRVYDKKWKRSVSSTVLVTVEDLSEEAVRNSGATRFKDTSAEEFIRVPSSSSSNPNPKSPYESFRALLANKLNTDEGNVQIISVQDVDGGYTDVRYSVHGSPYYPSSQSDSIVVLNKAEFEKATGRSIDEVPIDACAEEVFEGGCYNYMDITGNPALVNANGTSFVGVEVFIRAREGCRALDFPDPVECSGDYCYHGGTCVKNDFGVLACINCPPGFDGPRCQQLRHSFSGNNYAMYPTLEQCEDSETSIEFITTKGNGLLLYNGPATTPAADKPKDFISLELAGGLPVLNIDHGSGPATLALDGKDQNQTQVLSTLADGKWHKIDIVRKGKNVEMIVDDCKAAGMSGSETQPPDTRPCRISATSQGENSFLNVASLLQVGGRAPGHTYPGSNVVNGAGFDGCVRNLVHNSKYYDLHYKKTPAVPSGENGCPREDKICEALKCGDNGICTASFTPQQATCTCKPGWRGTTCADVTPTRDLKKDSFLQWRPKGNVQLPTYELEIQVVYRTWDTHGVLFTVATPDNTKRVTMELKDGRLQALYNLDNQDHTLLLNNTNASDGFWHVARFKRVMHVATLTLDHGEGRNHASLRGDAQSNVHMRLTSQSPMYGGAVVTSPSGAQVVDRDLTDTCIRDVRVNGKYLPIKSSENQLATLVEYVEEQNVEEGCSRENGCDIRPPVCPANSICVNLWGRGVCRCAPGYHDASGDVCESDCLPDNPCFMDVPCSVANGSVTCTCSIKPWYGALCNLFPTQKEEPSVGIAGGTIIAIVVSIILAIILVLVAIFLVTCYMRRKEKDDFDRFVVEEDADFDIRENIMFYDEEGAGEEDRDTFDLLNKLPLPVSETMGPREDMPRRTELPRGRSRVPDDRPDVGDVLHDRMRDADDDPDAPPHDTLIAFEEEGGGSDAGSLSSLGSSSSDASQDYDYLNDWGPKFAKLADMYGAGQE